MNPDALRLQLIETVCRLPAEKLASAADYLRSLDTSHPTSTLHISAESTTASISTVTEDWPHAPAHRLSEHGTYMVTTGTYSKAHVFRDPERLDLLQSNLLALARAYGWHVEAWAVFSNHYHFIAYTLSMPTRLREFLTELHANTAREVNRMDAKPGRRVWHNFWDKRLTFEKSYLARLNYVHQNAVKHGLVRLASEYRWCSAGWFERIAKGAQIKTVYGFKTDRIAIADEFEPLAIK